MNRSNFSGLCIASMLCAVLQLGFANPVNAGEGKVTGKVYTLWYYNLTDDSTITKRSEFDLTRAYFGYNYKIDDIFATSLTLDVERIDGVTKVAVDSITIIDTTGSYKVYPKLTVTKQKERYEAFLKTAYLEAKVNPMATFQFGMVPLFQFGLQEKFWGYRYLYKSFMDQYKFGSSADLGATVNMKFAEMLQINAGVTQGDGYKKPQDAFGTYRPALGLKSVPVKGLTLFGYGDFMPQPIAKTDSAALITAAAFAGYEVKEKFRAGVEYNYQMNQGGKDAQDVGGLSAYGSVSVAKPVEIFARLDILMSKDDWNLANEGKGIVAGIQYSPVKNVKIAADYQGFLSAQENATPQHRAYGNAEFSW